MKTWRLAAFVPVAMATLMAGCQIAPSAPGPGVADGAAPVEVAPHPLAPAFQSFLEGERLSQADRLRAAVTAFELAVSLQPDIAEFQRRRDETVKSAAPKEAALQKAEAQTQGTTKFDYDRARALSGLGEHDEATEAFQRVLTAGEKRADPRLAAELGALYREFGEILFSASRHEEAVRAYDRGLALNPAVPTDFDFYFKRGRALLRLGQREQALADFETWDTRQRPFAGTLRDLHRAVILQQLSRSAEAREAFDQYRRANQSSRPADLGDSLRRWEFFDEALAAYDSVLANPPADSSLQDVHIGRGQTLMDLRRHEEALAAFSNAVEALRENMFLQIIYRHRGDALAHLGRYEEALAAYDDASVAAARYPLGNTK